MGTSRHLLTAFTLLAWTAAAGAAEPTPQAVEFNRDVRPILSDHCFQCHGPDKAKRKADLRLDTEEGAFARHEDVRIIEPGSPAKSELYRRITARDAKEHMPPKRAGRPLTDRQIATLRRWIEQGAKWQAHWAFLPPRRPPIPTVKDQQWLRNPMDAFIRDRLEREGLSPSPEADKVTLIRRVSHDLTGLPPTPAAVDAFLADRSAGAYEQVVERLLHSPRYGEHMAVRWLDAARYADTNGYQSDGERSMWRWRDWVINALNANLPFDRFTAEQLAGDLLWKDEGGRMKDESNPDLSSFILHPSSLDLLIATGFNRNHRGNGEGGIIPEEYAVEYVVDRVDTTATVWLGLTFACARCHDHKYDPFKQKEFYQVFAYFNNVPERGRAFKHGNSPPLIQAPTPAQQEQLREVERALAAAEEADRQLAPSVAPAQARWEKDWDGSPPADWALPQPPLAHFPFDACAAASTPEKKLGRFCGGPPAIVPGRVGQAAAFDGKCFYDAGNIAPFGYFDKFSLAAWVFPDGPQGGTIVSCMMDEDRGNGYDFALRGGKLHVNLVARWLDDALRVETRRSPPSGRWHHVLMTYDGSRVAGGIKVYVDGQLEPLHINLDGLNQDFRTGQPLRVGAGGGSASHFHGRIDDVRIYREVLTAADAEMLATSEPIAAILSVPAPQRTKQQADKLRAYFVSSHAPGPIRTARNAVDQLRRRRERLIDGLPTTMVMQDMPRPRDTFVLVRGQYDKPGEKVRPGVPRALGSLPAGAPGNRLGFARWLVDPSNPLTAGVAVNRQWQHFFGTGLVKTVDDFGAQGEWPSHPELLDWLATEFMAGGWDVQALQRLIVTSATYRQSSKVTPRLLQQDPENRLLARGPRLRLSAEAIRDQALAVSGLLVEQVGGPSVKPYQPAALWKELADAVYVQDHGAKLYRRSLYTFWKRTVAPPAMMAFDAAGREACVVRQTRTNTPLQALNLMNEVTYVEAARVLAQRVMRSEATPAGRLTLMFRLATARRPRPLEMQVLLDGFRQYRANYQKDRQAALRLLRVGELPRDEALNASELAAYTTVASLILNLDETITKE